MHFLLSDDRSQAIESSIVIDSDTISKWNHVVSKPNYGQEYEVSHKTSLHNSPDNLSHRGGWISGCYKHGKC